MKTRVYILFLIASIGFVACKKEEPPVVEEEPESCFIGTVDISTYDTIWANPYFGAYHGSWWEFDQRHDAGYERIYCVYQPFDILTLADTSFGCTVVYKNTVVLPYIGGMPIYQNSRVQNVIEDDIEQTEFEVIIDTIVGNSVVAINHKDLLEDYSTQWDILTRTIHVISKDDTISFGDNFYENVLHLYIEDEHNTKIGSYTNYYHRYYSRNIGNLFSSATYTNWGTHLERYTTDYYIAPH